MRCLMGVTDVPAAASGVWENGLRRPLLPSCSVPLVSLSTGRPHTLVLDASLHGG